MMHLREDSFSGTRLALVRKSNSVKSEGKLIRSPGHHKVLSIPSSHFLNVSASNNHSPVPCCRLPKNSFCLVEKFRLDSQVTISRLFWSVNPFPASIVSLLIARNSAL